MTIVSHHDLLLLFRLLCLLLLLFYLLLLLLLIESLYREPRTARERNELAATLLA